MKRNYTAPNAKILAFTTRTFMESSCEDNFGTTDSLFI